MIDGSVQCQFAQIIGSRHKTTPGVDVYDVVVHKTPAGECASVVDVQAAGSRGTDAGAGVVYPEYASVDVGVSAVVVGSGKDQGACAHLGQCRGDSAAEGVGAVQVTYFPGIGAAQGTAAAHGSQFEASALAGDGGAGDYLQSGLG